MTSLTAEVLQYQRLANRFVGEIRDYPGKYSNCGITICAGSRHYLPGLWICVRMLREVGCELPIEVWRLKDEKIDQGFRDLLSNFGRIKFRQEGDSSDLIEQPPLNGGWELKAYSIINSSFAEVLALDADNFPIVNPEVLFECKEYQEFGSVFWPDYGTLDRERAIWAICEVEYRDEPEFETGQILVNKEKCWKELQLAMHYNWNSEFYFKHIHGDKDTFHMAWRRFGTEYAMPKRRIRSLAGLVMCQHDFHANRVFQHRNGAKFSIDCESC